MTERDFDPAATARVLAFALEHYPEKVDMLPVSELVMDSARQAGVYNVSLAAQN